MEKKEKSKEYKKPKLIKHGTIKVDLRRPISPPVPYLDIVDNVHNTLQHS